MNDQKKKKSRATNFSYREVDILCELIIKFSSVLESKLTDAYTWKQKNEHWDKLAVEFNRQNVGQVPRTTQSLKTKYECFKKELRKKVANWKRELYKTGGGTPDAVDLTPSEEKIYNLINLSVVGLPERYDDDSVLMNEYNREENDLNYEYSETVDKEVEQPMASEFNEEADGSVTNEELIVIEINNSFEATPSTSQSCSTEPQKSDSHTPSQNWKKWNPSSIKQPPSKELYAKKNKRLLTKIQAAERVNTLAQSKKELIELQIKMVTKELDIKDKEHDLRLKKAEMELESVSLDIEIKKLEKNVKEETLKKLLSGNQFVLH